MKNNPFKYGTRCQALADSDRQCASMTTTKQKYLGHEAHESNERIVAYFCKMHADTRSAEPVDWSKEKWIRTPYKLLCMAPGKFRFDGLFIEFNVEFPFEIALGLKRNEEKKVEVHNSGAGRGSFIMDTPNFPILKAGDEIYYKLFLPAKRKSFARQAGIKIFYKHI